MYVAMLQDWLIISQLYFQEVDLLAVLGETPHFERPDF